MQAVQGNICNNAPATLWKSLLKVGDCRSYLAACRAHRGGGKGLSGCTAALPRLGSRLQPQVFLPPLAVHLSLTKPPKSLAYGFPFTVPKVQIRQALIHLALYLSLRVTSCQHLRRCLRTGHKCRGISHSTLPALCPVGL